MRGGTGVVVALLVGLSLAALGGPFAPVAAAQEQPEADDTVTRIAVEVDGDARWTVRVRTRLDTPERVEQYRAFQDRFRANTSSYLDPFERRIVGVVDGAANATGRSMTAENFTASTSIQEVPRRWGVVTYAFTWRGFAAPADGSLRVGDVFGGGFFLAANDSLAFTAPEGYRVAAVSPSPDGRDDGTVRWVGRTDFPDGAPRVTFAPAVDDRDGPASPTASPSGGASGPSSPTAGRGDESLPLGWIALAGAVVLLGAGVVFARWRGVVGQRRGLPDESAGGREGVSEPSTDAGGVPPIQTDADRVSALLRENGGRMRQAAIAEELGWSASKASRVLSELAEEGRVEKLRLGRENVIGLPEDD